jgi:hypothetical protein
MRYLCVLLVLLATPLQVSAQQKARADRPERSDRGDRPDRDRSDRRQPDRQPPNAPPKAAIGAVGLPLPAIGLPAPPQYQKPWEWRAPSWERPQVPAWERQGPPAWERGHVTQPIAPAYQRRRKTDVVYVPYLAYPYAVTPAVGPAFGTPSEPSPPPEPLPETGFLRLEVEPAALLQIYVDGVFIGTPSDLGNELELGSGPHRIEIRAPGHETLTFDARIEVGRGITYRGELNALDAKPVQVAPPPVATGSRTLYVIPGCYLGNVLPDVSRLPSGCDISRMKTHTP